MLNPVLQMLNAVEEAKLWRGTRSLKRGQFLKSGGSIDRNIYLLTEGALRAYLITEKEEQTIRFGYADDILVALDSYISGAPSDLYIQALKPTHLQYLHREDLMRLLKLDPALMELWHNILEALILQQFEREYDLLTYSPSERYARVLKRSPRLFQEVPHKYIASYLRMTPETLSRLQKS